MWNFIVRNTHELRLCCTCTVVNYASCLKCLKTYFLLNHLVTTISMNSYVSVMTCVCVVTVLLLTIVQSADQNKTTTKAHTHYWLYFLMFKILREIFLIIKLSGMQGWLGGRVLNLWSKSLGFHFEVQQVMWENFLLQGQLSVLTVILVSVPLQQQVKLKDPS